VNFDPYSCEPAALKRVDIEGKAACAAELEEKTKAPLAIAMTGCEKDA